MAVAGERVQELKGKGFLLNRGTDCFSARIVSKNGVIRSEDMTEIARIAAEYGSGSLVLTTRLSVEVPGIPEEMAEEFIREVEKLGFVVGGTGAKVRPVVCCKGTTCIFGRADTQALAKEIYERYYLGWGDVVLPHKFKIAVGGCPNNCVKPDLNDFGIAGYKKGNEQQETLYKVYVGGRWGRKTRKGDEISVPVTKDQAMKLIERAMLLFRKEGKKGERFGMMIDRLGFENVEPILLSDEPITLSEN